VKAGDAATADATFRAAADLARGLGRADLLARAALGLADVRRTAGTVDQPLITLLNDALVALGDADSSLRARVIARYAAAVYHVEPPSRLAEISAEAVAIARRLGDLHTLVYVLRSTHLFHDNPHDLSARLASSDELVALAERINDQEAALYAHFLRIDILFELGDIARADAEVEAFGQQAEELRLPFYRWLAAVVGVMRALFDGRFEEAERLTHEAFALGREAQSETDLAFQFLAIQLFAVRWEQGRLQEMASVVEDLVRQYPALRWRVGLAFLHSELGNEEAARAEFEALVSQDLVDVPDDFNQAISLTFLADLCSRLGAVERAPLLYERLRPFEGRNTMIGAPAACVGSASRYLGMLAATMQRWDDAERHFQEALEMNQRMGTRPFVARTQLAFANMLIQRGRTHDAAAARELLAQARATAAELGMSRLLEEIALLDANALDVPSSSVQA
jgi:tetratricopeptide (TPR) repeat protein